MHIYAVPALVFRTAFRPFNWLVNAATYATAPVRPARWPYISS